MLQRLRAKVCTVGKALYLQDNASKGIPVALRLWLVRP